MKKKLYRSATDKKLGGAGLMAYIIALLVMPNPPVE